MIGIDFSWAVSICVFVFVNLVFIVWLFNKKQKDKDFSLDPRFIWHCSICAYTYINTKEGEISTCPRCGSYNKNKQKE